MEKNAIIFLIIGILILSGIGVYFGFFYETPNPITKDFPTGAVCPTYLEFCFEQDNPAFGCNMETQTCDEKEFRLVTIIGLLEEQNIKIYGTTWCPYCEKQLEDFGEYGDYVLEKGIYVHCDVEPIDPGCENVTQIPTWKQNGQTTTVGYLDIQKLISDANDSTNQ